MRDRKVGMKTDHCSFQNPPPGVETGQYHYVLTKRSGNWKICKSRSPHLGDGTRLECPFRVIRDDLGSLAHVRLVPNSDR